MDARVRNTLEIVAIVEIKSGEIIDHFPVDVGASASNTFEYYSADIGLTRCKRDTAHSEAVLVSVAPPDDDTTSADFRDLVAAAARKSKVSFGFVGQAGLDAA